MTWLIILVSLALIGMAGIASLNSLTFPRLRPAAPQAGPSPLVSILIPARDEAAVIGQTVPRLLAQSYAHFELIILDDHSTDATPALVRAAAAEDDRVRLLAGQPLPPGWLGKNWACQQLAQAAQGEWLIFTDADVQWEPAALSALVAELRHTEADLLTVWPSQHSHSWGERLVVPLMALAIVGYLPLLLVHHAPLAALAAANGQCLAFRRRAYQTIGGHQPVWNEVLEDVVLARTIKAAGLRLRMADGAGLIRCRMYRGWPEVRDGFAKNILAGYGGSVFFLLLATLFHWLVFVGPWLWLLAGWFLSSATVGATLWPVGPLLLIGLGLGVRLLTAAVTGQRLADGLLMPLSVLLMTRIAGQAIWWQWHYGGPRWKGRTIGRLEDWKDGTAA